MGLRLAGGRSCRLHLSLLLCRGRGLVQMGRCAMLNSSVTYLHQERERERYEIRNVSRLSEARCTCRAARGDRPRVDAGLRVEWWWTARWHLLLRCVCVFGNAVASHRFHRVVVGLPMHFYVTSLFFCFQVSICLECNSSKLRGLKRKWIRCSAQATVLHLKKFIAKKLNLTSFNEVCANPPGSEFCFVFFVEVNLLETSAATLTASRRLSLFSDLVWLSAEDIKAPPRCHSSMLSEINNSL